jgi:hypothetical protein
MPYKSRGDQTWGNDLYIFQAGPYCKVGRSYDVTRRAKEISAACPFPVEVACVFPGKGHQEGLVHRQFAQHRAHNEWFQICPCPVVAFVTDMGCTEEKKQTE